MNYMEAAMAPAEEAYRWKVYESAWGHLAPEKNKTYRGTLTIAFGCYHGGDLNPTILEETGMPCASPWWFDAVHRYLDDLVRDHKPNKEWDCGYVLRLNVTFRNFQFWLTNVETLVEPVDPW